MIRYNLEYSNPTSCCICLNDVTTGFVMECGHKFHCICIVRWVKEQTNCPMCRYDFERRPRTIFERIYSNICR